MCESGVVDIKTPEGIEHARSLMHLNRIVTEDTSLQKCAALQREWLGFSKAQKVG